MLGLLLAPSRELAVQIFEVIQLFLATLNKSEEHKISMCYFIGGDKLEYDIERINEKGAHIVVATPGRLIDLIG